MRHSFYETLFHTFPIMAVAVQDSVSLFTSLEESLRSVDVTSPFSAELTYLAQQWQQACEQQTYSEPPPFASWMASSEVDQKFLGYFAKSTRNDNPFLSSMLYKVLGLSVILSRKLLKARKFRRLDPTRETKSLQLYHQIVYLAREGLVITEQYVLPMVVTDTAELRVMAYKLRASFYHIIVLFHNQPYIVMTRASPSNSPNAGTIENSADIQNGSVRTSILKTPPPSEINMREGGPVGGTASLRPPGLNVKPPPGLSSAFLLPAIDYVPSATSCFVAAAQLADTDLPGSHPIRLSVKVEYTAFLYDCVHDYEASRKVAKKAILDVYNAQEGMDDESFQDAAEMVGMLGKMVKRGHNAQSAQQSKAKKDKGKGPATGERTRTTTSSASTTPRAKQPSSSTPTDSKGKPRAQPQHGHSRSQSQSQTKASPPSASRHTRNSSSSGNSNGVQQSSPSLAVQAPQQVSGSSRAPPVQSVSASSASAAAARSPKVAAPAPVTPEMLQTGKFGGAVSTPRRGETVKGDDGPGLEYEYVIPAVPSPSMDNPI